MIAPGSSSGNVELRERKRGLHLVDVVTLGNEIHEGVPESSGSWPGPYPTLTEEVMPFFSKAIRTLVACPEGCPIS